MRPRHRWAAGWLRGLAALLPEKRREWAAAMAAELDVIESGWEAGRWTLGSTVTMLRIFAAAALPTEWERGVAMSRVFVGISVLLVAVFWAGYTGREARRVAGG